MSSLKKVEGKWRLQFRFPKSVSRTITLGDCQASDAKSFQRLIDDLCASFRPGARAVASAEERLREFGDQMFERVRSMGLVHIQRPDAGTISVMSAVDSYVSRRSNDFTKLTRDSWKSFRKTAALYFGEDFRIDRVTSETAQDFRNYLLGTVGLSDNSARSICSQCSAVFNSLVNSDVLHKNPFRSVPRKAGASANRCYVPQETIKKLLKESSRDLKLMVGLSRFCGLRSTSETYRVTWEDIDFANRSLTVRVSKTKKRTGVSSRLVPLFPEMRKMLLEIPESERKGSLYVSGLSESKMISLLLATMEKCDLSWPRRFHSLRASCQTDLVGRGFPEHVVCTWLGNSVRVSREHYLLVTDKNFRRAVK